MHRLFSCDAVTVTAVYDSYADKCASAAESIKGGNIPVEIPDFTKGAYKNRKRIDV